MKKQTLFWFGIFLAGLISFSCQKEKTQEEENPVVQITNAEIDDLTFLIEEEKMARDIYLLAHDQYGEKIFNNISSSEQRHMDAIEDLLIAFNIPNPCKSNRGEFSNNEIQALYDLLAQKVNHSLDSALYAGATIEDKDIYDLDLAIAESNNETITTVYEKLVCASKNHMRAFSGKLDMRGITYKPQFISDIYYQEILNGSHEHCGGI